jgi:hypothetical protein
MFLGAGLASLAAALLGWHLGQPQTLSATPPTGNAQDLDGDGLPNQAESIHLTDPDLADSDGDGLSDLEELARGLDPHTYDANPAVSGLRIGMLSFSDGAVVRTKIAAYVPDGNVGGLDLRFGAFVPLGGEFNGLDHLRIELPPSLSYGNGSLGFTTTAVPGGVLAHFEVWLPASLFDTFGWLPLYSTLGPIHGPIAAAAADTLVIHGGVLHSVTANLQGVAPAPQTGGSGGGQVGGVVYKPIEPPDNIPTSSTPEQICYQETVPVGSVGGVLEVQIQSSNCVDADNFYCASDCSSQAGGTQKIIDPIALLGG